MKAACVWLLTIESAVLRVFGIVVISLNIVFCDLPTPFEAHDPCRLSLVRFRSLDRLLPDHAKPPRLHGTRYSDDY